MASEQRPLWSSFKLDRVLGEDAHSKKVALLGSFDNMEGQAIVTLTRKPFDMSSFDQVFSSEANVSFDFRNDIYNQYSVLLPGSLNLCDAVVVHPAKPKEIQKYTIEEKVIVRETPELFSAHIQPWIKNTASFRLSWVWNILNGVAEADRVIENDPDPLHGFVLLPDLKWNKTQIVNMYCLALIRRRDVTCLRDLRREHLALLRNIHHRGRLAIAREFGISPNKQRVYLHYHPSFYHLHCHFTHIDMDTNSCATERAHLIEDVIEYLERYGDDHYQSHTFTFSLSKSDEILKLLEAL